METLIASSEISSAVADFSMLSLFLRADFVVKSVIIILIISSIWSWTIIASKIVTYSRLKQLENEFDEIFWSGNSFDDLYETFNYNQNDPKSKIFCSAMEEWKKSKKNQSQMNSNYINSLKERMNRSMLVTFNKESELIEKAVHNVLSKGLRTLDIKQKNEEYVSTKEMGAAIIQELNILTGN